ncbi:glycosyltransferase family 4 protein [Capnocytophaga canis]|uniref:glycosyltransferase family 4 protein n=1 Tax=Capnocytophaga canis TaxID=1848903 RepID=UPI001562664E|nr:glycosyltransferase family 4 protein [Capnocytophaga canis]
MNRIKLFRITTVPISLKMLLKGQHRFMSDNGFEVVGVSSFGKELGEVSEDEGIRTVAIEMSRQIIPLQDLKSLWKMWNFLRKEKPQIVHSITPKAGLLSMLAAKMAGVPIRIHTFTGLIFPSKKGMMQKLLIQMDRLLCWAATHVYPEGEGVKKDLIKYRITSKPLKVIANGNVNGINTEHFSPESISDQEKQELKKTLNIQPDDFVFIFVGRLVCDKGINELITAFSELRLPDTKLLLVGGEEKDLDPLQTKTIQEIERNKNIIAVGFQKDVRPYFAISDCLAFPSYREGFPNVVMQAGAMGLPSIVSDINGCNEIIAEGENGCIIPSKSVEELKLAMKKMREDKSLYHSLQQNSRRMIVERYQQEAVWKALLEEYNFLIAGRNV